MIYIAFYKKQKTFTDKIVSFISRGMYTHVEIIVRGRHFYKDVMSFSASNKDGKKIRKKDYNLMNFHNEDLWDIYAIEETADIEKFYEFFENYEGKKYGFKKLFLNHLLRIRQNIFKNEYICSEFVAMSLNFLRDNEFEILNKDTHLLTPSNLAEMLLSLNIAKKITFDEIKNKYK